MLNNTVGRVVKALITYVGADSIDELAAYTGLLRSEVSTSLEWLLDRKLLDTKPEREAALTLNWRAISCLSRLQLESSHFAGGRDPRLIGVRDWTFALNSDVLYETLNVAFFDDVTKKAARKLYAIYCGYRAANESKFVPLNQVHWKRLDKTDRRCFIKAEVSRQKLGVSASAYVAAQFWFFRNFKTDKGRIILPQPHQLFGPLAEARVEEYKLDQEVDEARKRIKTKYKTHTARDRENRKLKSVAKLTGWSNDVVLRSMPHEFSMDFLQYKDVWDDVKDNWIEQREG